MKIIICIIYKYLSFWIYVFCLVIVGIWVYDFWFGLLGVFEDFWVGNCFLELFFWKIFLVNSTEGVFEGGRLEIWGLLLV